MNEPTPFKDLPVSEAISRLIELGHPRFRAGQLMRWVYQSRLDTFENMNNISKVDRTALGGVFSLQKLPVTRVLESSNHDAVKFAFELPGTTDTIESVLLYSDKRRTACLSSQLGCGLGCTFCATGTMGFIRNLSQGEILGQLIGINDYLASRNDKLIEHIVFMGMGEALSNFEAFKSSCEIIRSEDGFKMSGKRITVSTAGVVPSIERLTLEDLGVNLAISLNGATDKYRSQIMPVNRTYPIQELVAAGKRFALTTGMDLTFEYVVSHGVNDRPADVNALVSLLSNVPCKVNCIPLNRNPNNAGAIPTADHVRTFNEALNKRNITATVRSSKGDDICGACGQLRGSLAVSA